MMKYTKLYRSAIKIRNKLVTKLIRNINKKILKHRSAALKNYF